MNKITTTLMMFALTITAAFGQSVSENEQSMSLGTQMAYTVEIDGVDEDFAEDVIKDYFKEYGKVKRNKKAKEYYSEGTKLPLVGGSDELNLYYKLDERANMTRVSAWVDLGGGFVNSDDHPKEAMGMERMMEEVYVTVKKKAIEEEMEKSEKVMKKLEKGLKKLENKNEDYHENIEDAKKKIEENEANIEKNLKEQDDQRVLIAKHKEMMEEIIARLNNVGKK